MTATTALTAQDTRGVYDVHHVPVEFLTRQIDACMGDIGADVVKTGRFSLDYIALHYKALIIYPMGGGEKACWRRRVLSMRSPRRLNDTLSRP